MCSLSSDSRGDNVIIFDFEMGSKSSCYSHLSRFLIKRSFIIVLSTKFFFGTQCVQVPEQDNGSPVFRFSLEMLKVRSNKGSSNGQKFSVKKSAKNKLTKQDASILTETTVWDSIFDGNGLR